MGAETHPGTLANCISDKIKRALSTLDTGRLTNWRAAPNRAVALRKWGSQPVRLGEKWRPGRPPCAITRPMAWPDAVFAQYELAGILVDDMGLGKTVQTLAHILIERSGRLTNPALVIAPTSLMATGRTRRPVSRRACACCCCKARTARTFDQTDQADLVLTTCALLPRDEEKLREHDFHLVILTNRLHQEPLESGPERRPVRAPPAVSVWHAAGNHLGELWSQFHFLLPGFSAMKTFNSQFRHPIERQDDPLRRTAEPAHRRSCRAGPRIMANELPPKTEMVRASCRRPATCMKRCAWRWTKSAKSIKRRGAQPDRHSEACLASGLL